MRGVKILRIGPFSVAELLVVGVILMVVGASAMPRLSRGSDGIADAALMGNLGVLRSGLDRYAADHGGKFPSAAQFGAQMTLYTDEAGDSSMTQDGSHALGPYLRRVPLLPVGPKGYKGSDVVVDATVYPMGAAAGAWWYNARTGEVRVNLATPVADSSGKSYNRY